MNTNAPIATNVYIIDDDSAVRESLSLMLELEGFSVESFESASAFLAAGPFNCLSCAIVDIRMPDMNGLQLQQALIEQGVLLPIIFLTGFGDIPMSVRAIKAGAFDFLTKPITQKKLLSNVRKALRISESRHTEIEQRQAVQRLIDTLTHREREILSFIIAGQSNKETARLLSISHRTVEVHRKRIMEKMGVSNLFDLIQLSNGCDLSAKADSGR